MKPILRTFLILLLTALTSVSVAQKKRLILDSDTANEMDDLYAIVRLLADPSVELIALSSAHFNNLALLTDSLWNGYPTKGLNTVAESQKLNQQILKLSKRQNIPTPLGANRMVGEAWGTFTKPSPSEASAKIISQAKKMKNGERLDVMCIGASTNVASAIIEAPEIAPKLRVWMMGARFNPQTQVWDKDEFNIRNDLNAFRLLLQNKDVELHIIDANGSYPLRFNKEQTKAKLAELNHPLNKLLSDRWEHVNAGNEWVMWDLALVEAYLNPELTTQGSYPAPPEDGGRQITVITNIDAKKATSNFWNYYQTLIDN